MIPWSKVSVKPVKINGLRTASGTTVAIASALSVCCEYQIICKEIFLLKSTFDFFAAKSTPFTVEFISDGWEAVDPNNAPGDAVSKGAKLTYWQKSY